MPTQQQQRVPKLGLHALSSGVLLTPPTGVTLRKAPGHARFDYGQTLPLGEHNNSEPATWPARNVPRVRHAPIAQAIIPIPSRLASPPSSPHTHHLHHPQRLASHPRIP